MKKNAIPNRLAAVDRVLDKTYGAPKQPSTKREPLDVLIGAILSQNTSDRNSRRAYEAMRDAFPTWQDVRAAPRNKLERVLRPGGLAKTRSARIQRLLVSIADSGRPTLEHLKNMPTDDAEQFLLGFDGVGLKTARCVLLFGLGRDAFPIDTHIYRVLTRLGVIPQNMTPDKAHAFLPPVIPKGRACALHLNLIAHGRALCHPHNPECPACPLKRHCDYARSSTKTAQ